MSAARTYARQVRRDLRRHGCTCHPAVKMFSRATTRMVGAIAGAAVRHQLGCRLGDRLIPANDAGVVPSIVTYGQECTR